MPDIKARISGVEKKSAIMVAKSAPVTSDDFSAWNVSKWPGTYGAASAGGWIFSGMLNAPHVPAFSGGVKSAENIDLTKQVVWTELIAAPNPGNGSKMGTFAIGKADNSGSAIWNLRPNSNPTLSALSCEVDGITAGTISYDPIAHRWLRFRLGALYLQWESSPDGRTWTTRVTYPRKAWMSTLICASYGAGSWNADTVPGNTVWDNYCTYPTDIPLAGISGTPRVDLQPAAGEGTSVTMNAAGASANNIAPIGMFIVSDKLTSSGDWNVGAGLNANSDMTLARSTGMIVCQYGGTLDQAWARIDTPATVNSGVGVTGETVGRHVIAQRLNSGMTSRGVFVDGVLKSTLAVTPGTGMERNKFTMSPAKAGQFYPVRALLYDSVELTDENIKRITAFLARQYGSPIPAGY